MAVLPHAPSGDSQLDLAYRGLPAAAARVFRLLPANPGPDVSAAAVAALADCPVTDAKGALDRLVQGRLAEVAASDGERWRLPSPAREYALLLSAALGETDEREQALDRLTDYYIRAADAADELLRGRPAIAAQEEFDDRNGALAWLDAKWPSLLAMVRMAADTGRDQAAARLPLLIAQYLGFRGRFDELIDTTTIGLSAARHLGDQVAEGEALTNLGLALSGVRRFADAVRVHEDALRIVREYGDRIAEGQICNNLGLALHWLDQNEEATRVHQEAAVIFRETGGRVDEGKALNNLGLALRGLHQTDQAARAHLEAAGIFRATDCPQEEANSLANLGNVLADAGLQEKAGAAYRKAADIFHETGDDRAELMARQCLRLILERS